MEHSLKIVRVNISQLATLHEVAEVSEGEAPAAAEDGGEEGDAEADAGTNCIKIGLQGKLILSKRKGLREALFS